MEDVLEANEWHEQQKVAGNAKNKPKIWSVWLVRFKTKSKVQSCGFNMAGSFEFGSSDPWNPPILLDVIDHTSDVHTLKCSEIFLSLQLIGNHLTVRVDYFFCARQHIHWFCRVLFPDCLGILSVNRAEIT